MAIVRILELTDQNFDAEVLKADVPVLVEFTATWDGPGKALMPIIQQIADENTGTIKVGKMDIDENPETTRKYGVRSVPAVLAFRDGRKVGQSVGLTSRENLLQLLGL
jgi:thioredoxin 1